MKNMHRLKKSQLFNITRSSNALTLTRGGFSPFVYRRRKNETAGLESERAANDDDDLSGAMNDR